MVGLITVSQGDIQEIDAGINTSTGCASESHGTHKDDGTKSDETTDDLAVNEIVLQIVPSTEHDVQVEGLQALASIDHELLRQFATSVANELAQSQR